MDRNIAAFLDQSAYTIQAQFQADEGSIGKKSYTYVTNIPGIKEGDWIIVPTSVGSNRIALPTTLESIDDVLNSVPAETLKTHIHTGRIEVVKVVGVDKTVDLEPNSSTQAKWVIGKVDLAAYAKLMARNDQIVAATTKAYRKSMQRSFADRILGDMDQSDKDGLLKLLNT